MPYKVHPARLNAAGREALDWLSAPRNLFCVTSGPARDLAEDEDHRAGGPKDDWPASWMGEPMVLPAKLYEERRTPNGGARMGWQLTAAGQAAWHQMRAEPAAAG